MSRQDNTCAFCERPMETEVTIVDPGERDSLGGEDPEHAVPICRPHLRVVHDLPTWEEEPFPDWTEIEYGEEELKP